MRPRGEHESTVAKESAEINCEKFSRAERETCASAPSLRVGPPPNRHQTATKTLLQQFMTYYR
ncbi:hypothetical protein GCM10010174_52630 [Kutzneria viridogrisea]